MSINKNNNTAAIDSNEEEEWSLKEVKQKLLVLSEKRFINKTIVNIRKMNEETARMEFKKIWN